jgi:hypothetical protein
MTDFDFSIFDIGDDIPSQSETADSVKSPSVDLPPEPPSQATGAPLPAVRSYEVLSALTLQVRNQLCMLARTLYTLDSPITAEALFNLWPERATIYQFGFDENGALKAPSPSIDIIEEYINSEDYLDKMASLGIAFNKKDEGLSSKQIAFLSLVTDISSPLPLASKLKKVGTTWVEFQAWQKQEVFGQAYRKLGGDAVLAAIPLAELALASKMAAGDQKATEFGFLLTGHFDPNKSKQIDAQKLFGILLEIIDEKVKDPNERMAIGQELSLRGNRAIEM